ncbi:MAG: tetratricopeptide repeat protein [Bacteroidales bacterium]|nr:tetratricopeptide repeat protein [Bacteroidales bacterium]
MEIDMEERYNHIRTLISEEKLEQAMKEIEEIIKMDSSQDQAYYLKGNVFRKQQDWKNAINSYTHAVELNPNSPAADARVMCIEILNFFNTDMYNH